MGDPSTLLLVPASSPIDWTRISEGTKLYLIQRYGRGSGEDDSEHLDLPETIEDLAKMFDGAKFFGYMTPEILGVLMEISDVGLQVSEPADPIGPRFYMSYIDEVWMFLFAPGTRDCIMGYTHCQETNNDNDDEDEGEEEDNDDEKMAVAQSFDVKLVQDASEGIQPAEGVLNGWNLSAVPSRYEGLRYGPILRRWAEISETWKF